MFDIGWSEFVVIAVVALIAIGPKELPGVLRMVGQWVGKARKMAGEFQGQFQEAMREAEMADLKKSFDEVAEAGKSFASDNVMTSLQTQVGEAMRIDSVETPASATPDVQTEAPGGAGEDGHVLLPPVAQETQDIQPQAAVEEAVLAPPDIPRDAKAS